MNLLAIALYSFPVIAIMVWYARRHRRIERLSRETLQSATAAGLTAPATLHPEIDPTICIGCGACVAACPEQNTHPVLGMIRQKARLIGPTDCIGHGACKAACPVGAITLVFGTSTRGVDIPLVKPTFETDVPGIFIAGELGGMGLVRNAVEQGRQAMDSIAKIVSQKHSNKCDVVIVGAGPAGISASLGAKQKKLNYVTLEQDTLGGTVAQFPRRKLVMTQPAELPIIGKVKFKEVSKEALIEFWQEVERKTRIRIRYRERVETVEPLPGGGFTVHTSEGVYNTRTVLLTIGRRGTPRKLGVPGEDMTKVAYRLVDPEQYRNQHVLVVGGGDSALEAAISLAEEPGTTVTLSYRSTAFNRAKARNRDRALALADSGELNIVLGSNVKSIAKESVVLSVEDREFELPNDSVLISAGGILPTEFLKRVGITVETKWGTE